MTGTDVGLPASPVVDGKRHLTPEWLHALAEIETLKSLKDTYAEVKKADVSQLLQKLDDVEKSLQETIERGVPNNIVATNIPTAEAKPWTTGIPHQLGTAAYIPMTRYKASDSDRMFMQIIATAGGTTMSRKDESLWTWDNTDFNFSEASWFTFTITSEGAPQ